VLWTYLHAGVSEKDPAFQKLYKVCADQPLWRTYNVALWAMILQKLERKAGLAACAKFFVETQCENGQWDYGDGYKSRQKSKVGDNSNSQYAALGLRACREAGVDVPDETLKRALAWWQKSQREDGSWNYNIAAGAAKDAPILQGCGSMTCGGIGSVAILHSLLKQDPRQDAALKKAVDWLAENFSVAEHPKYVNPGFGGNGPTWWYYYYLYSLERAGDLLAAEKFGESEWYPEGARELLKRQKSNGSWKEPSQEWEVYSTCFAILFLKRATPPIKTESAQPKKD
jgi:hypothetical protein